MLLQRLYCITNRSRILQRVVLHKSIPQIYKKKNSMQIRMMTSSFAMIGAWGLIKNKSEDSIQITKREVLIAKADAFFDQGDYKSIYDLLSNYKDSKDVEILWRLSRALYKMSETASDVEARKLIYEGYDLIRIALDIQEDHYAIHKWLSILLNCKSAFEGTKAQMREINNVKKHMLRASELNPTDATTFHILGCWCYEVSDLAWYQRKIASLIFGEPPTSSFEEALSYFENAEKVDPNFYSHNLLMLGKTYLKLNRKKDAIKFLKKAAEFSAKNDDDHKAKQEAQKILNSI